jgi:Transglycosylase SLT domain
VKLVVTMSLVGALLTAGGSALARPEHRPCSYRHTVAGNRATIRCFAHKMHVDAGRALAIAQRESGFNEWAYNASSGALGLFQHLRRYWDGRVRMAGRALRRWNVDHKAWHNPRVQSVVTFVYVHRFGWGAWNV